MIATKNYWTNEDCDNTFTNINRKIDYTMMCALGNSTPRTDACDGDSGSALYDKEKDKVRSQEILRVCLLMSRYSF